MMLFILLIAVLPLSILDFVLRAESHPAPHWLGDVLAFTLLALSALFVRSAWEQRKRKAVSRTHLSASNWSASLPCLVHEIRNYSSVIKGNALLLRLRMDGPEIQGPLGRLERTTDKIELLAQEILDAVSPSQDANRRESLCLRALLEYCITEHFHEAQDVFRIDAVGLLPAIYGDPGKLERVFLNLFRNAREAGGNAREAGAKTIRIRMRAAFGRLRIWVEDDGHGCAPEAMARLFQPLYTTKKANGGTGLGLFLVKGIVEEHGGKITAMSANARFSHGRGMVFRLEFPIGAQPKSNPPIDNPESRSVSLEESVG